MNWRKLAKWAGGGLLTVVLLLVLFASFQIFSFNRAADTVLERPEVRVAASTDSVAIERGRHIAESFGGCFGCHGENLGGQLVEDMGPIGALRASNLTSGNGGVGTDYTDSQLAQTIRWGVRPDGRSLVFMPTQEHNWWPDEDLVAVVSFVRSMPPVDNVVEPSRIGPLGKILGNLGVIPWFSAQMVDPDAPREQVPAPEPTARYGAYLARSCSGCHGENFSGGPIPGAPPSLPTPRNITPHAEGLAGWTFETFMAVVESGNRPDGTPLNPFMPVAGIRAMNDTERTALWAFLQTVEPLSTGTR